VFILDDEGLLLTCNHYAFELFGDRQGHIKDNSFFNLVVDEDRLRIQTKLTTLFASGHEAVDEVRMHTHEDRNRFNWFTIHTRKTVIDNCDYLVLVCIDISQLKRSESHLFEYKKWLIMAMEAGNTGVWDWNIVTDAALWSNRLWKLYGIEKHSGQHPSFKLWETSIHPDDREMVVQSVRQAVFLLADLNIEYRVVHPDGSVRWILANGKPVYDKYGVVKRYCGSSIDITDQKQFEDDMTLIREHLDFVLEKFHIGWFHLNLKDHSAVRTIEHARIFGYESMETEWSFEKFLEHVVDEDRQRVKNLVFGSISNNKDFTTECRIRRANGETRRIWASGSLIYDDRSKPTHIVGIVQDVTGRSVQ
jgi:PAS domain S-box-containing protein